MNPEIDDIRDRVAAVLADVPSEAELAELPADSDLNILAQRLEQAHEVLVRALESVERG